MKQEYRNKLKQWMNVILVKDLKIPLNRPLDLVILAVKKSAMRCKVVASGDPITFRKVRYEVEGEIITVKPSKL
jgi:hypothetical protein